MFEIFSGKKKHFIGIDFGTSSIKVVELSYRDQKAFLENYGVVDLNWASQGNEKNDGKSATYEQKLRTALGEAIKKMQLSSGTDAYVSIPGFSGLITIIELPEMKEEELAKAIQFEAHKYIPSSLDEIAMSWEVVDRPHKNSLMGSPEQQKQTVKKVKVLLVAAPKKEIERYDRLVTGLDFSVNAIELETFSIARALVGEEQGTYLVIDIGSRATNMILIENGIIQANRNIDAGGNEVTISISDGMNISKQRAEIFKKGDKDLLNGEESPIVIPVLELIAGESQRILNAYREKNREAKIDSVILSGGTSRMKGLEEYLSKQLGMKVSKGDPWKKIMIEAEVEPLTKELGSSFSVAIGLALRGMEEYKRKN
jgi:type IV pilus assembly protein PilM